MSDETEKKQLDMIGMMLGKHIDGVLDMDTMVIKTQERLMNSLERGIEYDGTVDDSDNFLRQHVWKKLPMVVMYIVEDEFTDHHYEHVECPDNFTI